MRISELQKKILTAIRNQLSHKDLIDLCTTYGLSSFGNKRNVQDRLEEFIHKQNFSDLELMNNRVDEFTKSIRTVPSSVQSVNQHESSNYRADTLSESLISSAPINLKEEVSMINRESIVVVNFTRYNNTMTSVPIDPATGVNERVQNIRIPNMLPYVSVQTSPFYCCPICLHPLSMLIPKIMPNVNQNNKTMTKALFKFSLSDDALKLINRNCYNLGPNKVDYKWQVLLKFIAIDPNIELPTARSTVMQVIPPYLTVTVNNQSTPLWEILPSNCKTKEGKRHPKPVNITDKIDSSNRSKNCYPQMLEFNWWQCPGVFQYYYMGVYLERKLSVSELLSLFVSNRHVNIRPIGETLGLIKSKLNDPKYRSNDGDDDLVVSSVLPISLSCPVGRSRIEVPIRALKCQHLQCFDAQLFLSMNERRSMWKCPVCDISATPNELFCDKYFQKILEEFKDNEEVNDINVNSDGTYVAVFKRKDDKAVLDKNVDKEIAAAVDTMIVLDSEDEEEQDIPSPAQVPSSKDKGRSPSKNKGHSTSKENDRSSSKDKERSSSKDKERSSSKDKNRSTHKSSHSSMIAHNGSHSDKDRTSRSHSSTSSPSDRNSNKSSSSKHSHERSTSRHKSSNASIPMSVSSSNKTTEISIITQSTVPSLSKAIDSAIARSSVLSRAAMTMATEIPIQSLSAANAGQSTMTMTFPSFLHPPPLYTPPTTISNFSVPPPLYTPESASHTPLSIIQTSNMIHAADLPKISTYSSLSSIHHKIIPAPAALHIPIPNAMSSLIQAPILAPMMAPSQLLNANNGQVPNLTHFSVPMTSSNWSTETVQNNQSPKPLTNQISKEISIPSAVKPPTPVAVNIQRPNLLISSATNSKNPTLTTNSMSPSIRFSTSSTMKPISTTITSSATQKISTVISQIPTISSIRTSISAPVEISKVLSNQISVNDVAAPGNKTTFSNASTSETLQSPYRKIIQSKTAIEVGSTSKPNQTKQFESIQSKISELFRETPDVTKTALPVGQASAQKSLDASVPLSENAPVMAVIDRVTYKSTGPITSTVSSTAANISSTTVKVCSTTVNVSSTTVNVSSTTVNVSSTSVNISSAIPTKSQIMMPTVVLTPLTELLNTIPDKISADSTVINKSPVVTSLVRFGLPIARTLDDVVRTLDTDNVSPPEPSILIKNLITMPICCPVVILDRHNSLASRKEAGENHVPIPQQSPSQRNDKVTDLITDVLKASNNVSGNPEPILESSLSPKPGNIEKSVNPKPILESPLSPKPGNIEKGDEMAKQSTPESGTIVEDSSIISIDLTSDDEDNNTMSTKATNENIMMTVPNITSPLVPTTTVSTANDATHAQSEIITAKEPTPSTVPTPSVTKPAVAVPIIPRNVPTTTTGATQETVLKQISDNLPMPASAKQIPQSIPTLVTNGDPTPLPSQRVTQIPIQKVAPQPIQRINNNPIQPKVNGNIKWCSMKDPTFRRNFLNVGGAPKVVSVEPVVDPGKTVLRPVSSNNINHYKAHTGDVAKRITDPRVAATKKQTEKCNDKSSPVTKRMRLAPIDDDSGDNLSTASQHSRGSGNKKKSIAASLGSGL